MLNDEPIFSNNSRRTWILIAIFAGILGGLVTMVPNPLDYVWTPIVNNTDMGVMGTGERVSETIYYTNNSPIQLMVFAHANVVGDTATAEVFINGIMVQNQSGRPLGGAEQTYRSIAIEVPSFSNYTAHFHNYHHYEWREYKYDWVRKK